MATLLFAACAIPPLVPTALGEVEPGPPRRYFAVPGSGALELAMPAGWAVSVEVARPGEEIPPLAFRIDPGDGRFTAVLAPEPAANGRTPAERLAGARELAGRSLRAVAAGSAEEEPSLRDLKGDGMVRGYWFAVSDRELTSRAPSQGEWRGAVGGAVVVGELLLSFTLLDDLPGRHRGAFLDLLATARHLPPLAGEPEPTPDRFAPGSRLNVPLPGRDESIEVSVPGFLVTQPGISDGGLSVTAHARDPGSGIRVAVNVHEGERGGTAPGCRARDLARLQGTGGGVRELMESERGGAALAAYVTSLDLADRRHSRAWFARDRLCVDLDLSGGGPEAGSLDAILDSVRFVGQR